MRFRFLAALFACAWVQVSLGATYTEIGDAGQTLITAQPVNTLPLGTPLSAIFGNLELGGADIFGIYLTGGQTFSATTVNGSTFIDTQLFLFTSAGLGVYANDDDPNSPPQSTLPAGISFTPIASGFYYLAVSGAGFMPVSSGGFIFPVSGGFLDQSGGIQNTVGPTGPGGASALTGWSSLSSENGAYEIDLTGAQFIPEPSSALLVASGLIMAGARRYGKRKK